MPASGDRSSGEARPPLSSSRPAGTASNPVLVNSTELLRDSTGSGQRANVYEHEVGPLLPENLGKGNRLEFLGTAAAFEESNAAIAPAPPAELFAQEG